MKEPGADQFSRIHAIIESLEGIAASRVGPELDRRREAGEDPLVLSYVQLHFGLPVAPHRSAIYPEGSRVGDRYTIQGLLGSGGMGIVYRAVQDVTLQAVAVKVVHPALACDALLARFQAEIQTLGRLNHPAVVRIFDAGRHTDPDGRQETIYYAMQLVEGRPADRFVREQALTVNDTLRLLSRLCDAVQAAHDGRVVHRDLKPGNVLVDAQGRPFLLDFGLAVFAGAGAMEQAGLITGLSGTPRYMSPEQVRGLSPESPRGSSVDIYALGVIAFELLAARSPYDLPPDASVAQLRDAIENAPPRLLSECRPDLGRRLSGAIDRALRKNPAERFLSAAALGKALLTCVTDRAVVPPDWAPAEGRAIPATDWILDGRIGSGGAGEVWLARHPDHGRRVFKFCRDLSLLRSLQREGTLFRLLNDNLGLDPRFVRLYDVSIDDSPHYLSMEHVEGGDLAAWAERQGGIASVPLEVRLELMADTAEALACAHEAGVLHCDIKPGNLLIRLPTAADSRPRVCLADFGIGRLALEESRATRTGPGLTRPSREITSTMAGTALYLAPELVSGESPSISSDLYSLGVVLFQMIVGDFRRALTIDWERAVPDPLLREDLRRCFTRLPDERFQGARELAQSLRSLEARRTERARAAATQQHRERQAYRRGVLRAGAIATVVVLALGALTAIAIRESRVSQRATSEARLGEIRALARSGQAGWKEAGLRLIESSRGPFADPDAYRQAALTLLAGWDLRQESVTNTRPKIVQASPATAPLQTWPRPGHPQILTMDTSGDLFLEPRPGEPGAARRRLASRQTPSTVAVAPVSGRIAWRGTNETVDGLDPSGAPAPPLHADAQSDPYAPASRPATALSFNPADDRLAWMSLDSLHVQIWQARGALPGVALYHPGPVRCGTWLDRDRFAAGCLDGNIYVWNLQNTPGLVADSPESVLSCDGIPQHLLLMREAGILVSFDDQGRGVAWDARRLSAVRRFQLERPAVCVVPAEGGFIAAHEGLPSSRWRLEPSTCWQERGAGFAADELRYSHDGKWVAAITTSRVVLLDDSLEILDAADVPLARDAVWPRTDPGRAQADDTLVVSTRDGPRSLTIERHEHPRFGPPSSPWPPLSRPGPAASLPNGRIAVAQGDRWIVAALGQTNFESRPAPWPIDYLQASSDGGFVACGSEAARAVEVWSTSSKGICARLTNAAGWGEFASAAPYWIGVAGDRLQRFDQSTWQGLPLDVTGANQPGDPAPLSVAVAGSGVFVLNVDREISWFDLATGRRLLRLESPHRRRGRALASSPGGRELLVSTEEGVLERWDLAALERELTRLGLHW